MKTTVLFGLALALVLGVIYLARRKTGTTILPARELQRRHSLFAEKRVAVTLNPALVPEHLRDLIPMAQEWGEGDDIIRSDMEQKATVEAKNAFRAKMAGRTHAVNAWLDSLHATTLSEEAAQFMHMLQALDEMGLWPD